MIFFKVIFCVGTLLALFTSSSYVEREMRGIGEYYVLIFIATFGMMVMASSVDLITIFLGLEVMSIPLYVLAGIYRKRLSPIPQAPEARHIKLSSLDPSNPRLSLIINGGLICRSPGAKKSRKKILPL